MIKKEGGQIFSVDALIALVIAVLALGITLQVMEAYSYNIKEGQIFDELKSVGHTASNLLVTNKDIVCELKENGRPLTYLNNCIDLSKQITKEALGIAAHYKCYVGSAAYKLNTDCVDDSADEKNVYSEEREVIFSDGAVDRKEFLKCMEGKNCQYSNGTVEVKVWK